MDRINLEREERRQEMYHGERIGADNSHEDQLSGFRTLTSLAPKLCDPDEFPDFLFFNLHTR